MDHDSHEAEAEPQTPMWLPALGIALFLIAGIWWATRNAAPQAAPPSAPVASASAAASH
jgi:hypothetical protein